MSKTLVEKILSRAAGRPEAHAGTIVQVDPDIVLTHDHQGPMTIREFRNFGDVKLKHPERLYVFMDHRTPSQTEIAATNHKVMREFCKEQGVEHLFDVGTGICHDQLAEQVAAKPGQIVVGTDSHTVTIGGLGVFGTGIGSSEMAALWVRGTIWFRIPETIKVVLTGSLKAPLNGKDIALALLRILNTDGATYKSMEFHGEGVSSLSTDSRMTLCNMCLEMGAKTALFPVDDITRAYYAQRGVQEVEALQPDPDAHYEREITIDLDALKPMVATPNSPGNAVEAETIRGEKRRIDQALIGTCTNGRISDMREAAAVLKNRKVHSGVRMLIVPATRSVLRQCLDEGLIKIFLDAGAMVGVPSCGPCGAYGMGAVAADEVCITTGSRNFVARLGSPKGILYLGSPATVAASAVAGYVTDRLEQN
ncbi:MAG TPA: 3-isopropylmalate dehydratase large subunit [Candidatus Avidesulfovibrio excrementigallinarum]|nr:3-isopropylmalate dehydratase large subunit [Candidatus Avidesulfovibrio excrementigallinarum]